jgi:hypothetical protein
MLGQTQRDRPTIANGVITYPIGAGKRAAVKIEEKCADLWVSPGADTIAFISMDKTMPPSVIEAEPFIEESTIFLARKSDQYVPRRVDLGPIRIDGRDWRVVREPSLSPDGKTLHFMVPFTMTTWKLMSKSLPAGPVRPVTNAAAYCVIWGGEQTGKILMMKRRMPDSARLVAGVTYPCYLRDGQGLERLVAGDKECWAFQDFAPRWSREHGGACFVSTGQQDEWDIR